MARVAEEKEKKMSRSEIQPCLVQAERGYSGSTTLTESKRDGIVFSDSSF